MDPVVRFSEWENAMCKQVQQQPSKESVRNWLRARQEQKGPPPDGQQIRRELGWGLVRPLRRR